MRTPLGLFTAIVVVGVALIAGAMTAFGGSSAAPPQAAPRPLTPAQFKLAGQQIGHSLCVQLKPIVNKKPHSLRQLKSGIHRISAIFDRLRVRLYALVPPPSRARDFYRFRNKFDRAAYDMNRADHLAETGQWRRFVLYVRSKSFKQMGKRFGPSSKGPLSCGHAGHAAT